MKSSLSIPKISELRSRIVIQSLVRTPDGQGGFDESWTTFNTVWAKFSPWKGGERWATDQLRSEFLTKIEIRYLAGVNTSMRILFDSRKFQIKSVTKLDEAKFFMSLYCEENTGS